VICLPRPFHPARERDFVMAYVPRSEAGTAGGSLTAAQRIGSAIGIAVIGTVLFGTVGVRPGPDGPARAFTHGAQLAVLASVAFVLVALLRNLMPDAGGPALYRPPRIPSGHIPDYASREHESWAQPTGTTIRPAASGYLTPTATARCPS
jgi:hypothetical protein